MKVRLDFVTNSSSSSFLIGRKNNGELTIEAKEKLVTLVMNYFGIKPGTVTAGNELDKSYREDEELGKIEKAEQEGFEVLEGFVSFEDTDYQLSELADAILKVLSNEPNYKVFPYDLSY